MTTTVEPTVARWLGVLPVLVLLLAWEAVCRIGGISPALLPAPTVIAGRAVVLFGDPDFLLEVGITMRRLAAGFVLALIVGATLGI